MYLAGVKFSLFKQTPVLIAIGVIGLVCLMQSIHHDFLERLERMSYDWRARQAMNFSPAVATNLGFVAISDKSITRVNDNSLGFRYGLYWPRHIYGRVVRELQAEGAKVVGFDILFGGLRPDHTALVMADDTTLNSDEYFGLQMKQAGNVIIASQEGVMPPRLFRTNALALGDISAEKDSDGILRRAKAFRIYRKWHRAFQQLEDDPKMGVDLSKARVETNRISLPRPEIDEPQKSSTIKFPLDQEGNFDLVDFVGPNLPAGMKRYAKPFTEERIWHMGIVLAAQELKLDLANAKVELDKGRITLRGPNGLKRVIPVDRDGFLFINWALTTHDDRLIQEPFEALLALDQMHLTGQTNELTQAWKKKVDWRDKLVLIGSSATGNDLTDRGATSLEKDTLLVSEHWNVANSVLTGRFIHRSSLPMELALIVAMGALAAYLTWICRSYIASLWILLALVAYGAITVFAFVAFRYWMPLVLPVVGGLLTTHFCLLGYLVIFEQSERRRLRSVFTKVVSPDVVTELLKTEKLSLTGTQRNLTVFFSDIRGFTEMTDVNRDQAEAYIKEHSLVGEAAEAVRDKQARETLTTVNAYLEIIANIVFKHSGTVDKFIGDCVMAFWGAPLHNPHHALCCVRAAIETQRAVYNFNHQREAENRQREAQNLMLAADGRAHLPLLPILVVGTGINTGVVTVGLMGAEVQGNYTVFGREVNLASRLETVSGRARIIISESTLAEIIQDDSSLALSCVSLPPEKVKGIRDAVRIYEVPWREGEAAVAGKEAQSSATQVYNTGYFTAGERVEGGGNL